MNKILPPLIASVFFIGCTSTQQVSTYVPAEQHLAAKAQYYEDLYQRQHSDSFDAVAEIDTSSDRATAAAGMIVEEQGWQDTTIGRVHATIY